MGQFRTFIKNSKSRISCLVLCTLYTQRDARVSNWPIFSVIISSPSKGSGFEINMGPPGHKSHPSSLLALVKTCKRKKIFTWIGLPPPVVSNLNRYLSKWSWISVFWFRIRIGSLFSGIRIHEVKKAPGLRSSHVNSKNWELRITCFWKKNCCH